MLKKKKQTKPDVIDEFPLTPLHNQSSEAVLVTLSSSKDGISKEDAARRLKQYGPNALKPKKPSLIKRILEPFASVFVSVLVVAMIISVTTGHRLDAIVITLVLTLNALIYYAQQWSAGRVLKALEKHDVSMVDVKRGGEIIEIPSADIVPGDIIYLHEGLKVPADGRVIESEDLHIDESVITGESLPVSKIAERIEGELQIYDQKNMAFKGSLVHSGNGIMVVSLTGNRSELGKISLLASSSKIERTPIERKIDSLAQKLVMAVSIAGASVFTLAIIRGIDLSEAIRFSLSLIVSAVPEGLPVALTVVLLLNAKKLAKVNALIKKTASIETMGALTMIATDKTGTLTKNKLSVAKIASVDHDAQTFAHAIIASLNGEKKLHSDPLDEILSQHFKESLPKDWEELDNYPFQQQLRASGALWRVGGKHVLYVKGAPETLLAESSTAHRKQLEVALADFARRGYRTIAVAHRHVNGKPETLTEDMMKDLTMDGIIGLADELRDGIADSIREAREAGISVVMLTGDHTETAGEIARKIGLIKENDQVSDSSALSEEKIGSLPQLLTRVHAFGRILPEHKFNFLKAVKGKEITAMTGDGVNDIPALVEADAGLAMGSGTDAAKDASDIVLLDDNFQTIISAVRLGRAVLSNIRKMLFYLISTSLGEVITMTGALLLGLPLPIAAAQILWINLVTDSFSVLPIGLTSPEKHQMKQPPANPNAPLLNKVYVSRMILIASGMAITVLFLFNRALPQGENYAQTIAFFSLVTAQWANALNAVFERSSWTRNFIHPNYLLGAGIFVGFCLQMLVMYGPLAPIFGVATLSASELLMSAALPVVTVLLLGDMHKLITRKMKLS